MQLIDELRLQAEMRGAVFCRTADLTSLPNKQTRGYRCGIVLGMEMNTVYDFAAAEMRADRAADAIEVWLRAQHYDALSQSERSLAQHSMFDAETRSSMLPHKTVAVMAGVGWIGRNNLLVTEEYGCKLAMCTVLTNAPLPVEPVQEVGSRCGSCMACVRACPTGALTGEKWTPDTLRDEMVDVNACRLCLKCMQVCPRNGKRKQ